MELHIRSAVRKVSAPAYSVSNVRLLFAFAYPAQIPSRRFTFPLAHPGAPLSPIPLFRFCRSRLKSTLPL